jgi:hypothetical protein
VSDGAAEEQGGLVEVSRSGGFAGMTLHGRVNVDRLDDDARRLWQRALSHSFTGLGETRGQQPGPDRFVYRVRNQRSGLDVTVGDQEIPDDLRALLDTAVRPPP